ncbi:MAG: replicative DNA helicase [Candidatus Muiribacteriota bacterium]
MKTIPQSIEAEKAVLGSILLENKNLKFISDKLSKEDFYSVSNSKLYNAMCELEKKGESIEPFILKEYFQKNNQLESIGGLAYINSLLSVSVSSRNIESYVNIIREKSILRQLISICSDLSEDCFNSVETEVIFDKAERNIIDIIRKSSKQDFVPINQVVNEVIEKIESAYEKKENIVGLSSGFIDLDRITSGFQKSDLIILAARPGVGKTAFCLNLAANAALKEKQPVAIFSLEMPATQLVQRILSSEAEVDQEKLRKGNLSESEFGRLVLSAGRVFDAGLFINDSGFLTINELKAAARKAYMEHNIKMIVVDYLQLLSGGNKNASRVEEISEISRNLKSLAKELNIPIIALSQLSRKVEERNDKRPMLSDLRESGAIEQDADMILFLYRDDYYTKENSSNPNQTELIIAKHRNGSLGTVQLYFKKECTKFKNLQKK